MVGALNFGLARLAAHQATPVGRFRWQMTILPKIVKLMVGALKKANAYVLSNAQEGLVYASFKAKGLSSRQTKLEACSYFSGQRGHSVNCRPKVDPGGSHRRVPNNHRIRADGSNPLANWAGARVLSDYAPLDSIFYNYKQPKSALETDYNFTAGLYILDYRNSARRARGVYP